MQHIYLYSQNKNKQNKTKEIITEHKIKPITVTEKKF